MKHTYRAYGLTFQSDVALPGLTPLLDPPRTCDVIVTLRCLADWAFDVLASPPTARRLRPTSVAPDEPGFVVTEYGSGIYFRLSYGDGTYFVVDRSATRISGEVGTGLTLEDLCVYLLGPIMGFVMRLRNRTPLHASAIMVEKSSIAFVGEAGAGKSTTVAALALRGYSVLTEDVCALEECNGRFAVVPGYPRISLWPDSVGYLFSSSEALPLIVKGWEKRFLALDGLRAHFAQEAAPLRAIFFLAGRSADPDAPRIEKVSSKNAVLALVQNTYMNWLLNKAQRADEFDVLTRTVSVVECFRLIPSADPARLGAMADLIQSHSIGLANSKPRPTFPGALHNV